MLVAATPCPLCDPRLTAHLRPPWQAAVDGMARQSQQAQRMVTQDRALTPAVCAAAAPPVPPVDACLQGLREIW